jgi:hypothetical protein
MARIRFNMAHFSSVMRNTVEYSKGFMQGIEENKILFNQRLGDQTVEALYRFIDSKARMSPDSLHHVYEWNATGSPGARLFKFNAKANRQSVTIVGDFLPSKSISDSASSLGQSTEPFVDKANIMENQITIVVSPRSSEYLVFESSGEPVFTVHSVIIDNPGGDEVSGSFGRVVDEFFDSYFTTTFLKQSGIFDRLRVPKEFSIYFPAGANGGGRAVGRVAGKKYYSGRGHTLS